MKQQYNKLALAGFALPVVGYLLFIHQYGVNTIARDQWDDVGILDAAYSGNLSLNVLWSQWAVERLFFPRLVVIALADVTHLNTVVEMYMSASLLMLAIALFIVTHKRRSPTIPWLYYCPVAFLMLSLVQYENTLWGFQLAWYLILAAFAVVVFLLDRPIMPWWILVVAIVAAIMASYSSFQGLLIWPAALVLLYHRHRSRGIVATWCGVAVLTGAFYFFHFNFKLQAGNDSFAVHHPIEGVKFFLSSIGNILGVSISYFSSNDGVMLFGIALFVCAIWLLIRFGLNRDESGASPIGITLICFGLLWVLSITLTQSSEGMVASAASRFTTYELLIPLGCYLTILDRPLASRGVAVVSSSVLALMCIAIVFGTVNGLAGGSYTYQSRIVEAKVTANAQQATRSQLLAADPIDGLAIPTSVPIARNLRLSMFATGSAGIYGRSGLDEGLWASAQTPHVTPWAHLTNGEIVRVNGGGFAANTAVVISQCGRNIATAPLSPASLSGTRTLPSLSESTSTLATCKTHATALINKSGYLSARIGVNRRACRTICYVAVLNPEKTPCGQQLRFVLDDGRGTVVGCE